MTSARGGWCVNISGAGRRGHLACVRSVVVVIRIGPDRPALDVRLDRRTRYTCSRQDLTVGLAYIDTTTTTTISCRVGSSIYRTERLHIWGSSLQWWQ